jgi:hypothetical protein
MESSISRMIREENTIRILDMGGNRQRFDVIYSALGVIPQSQLAQAAAALAFGDALRQAAFHAITPKPFPN